MLTLTLALRGGPESVAREKVRMGSQEKQGEKKGHSISKEHFLGGYGGKPCTHILE